MARRRLPPKHSQSVAQRLYVASDSPSSSPDDQFHVDPFLYAVERSPVRISPEPACDLGAMGGNQSGTAQSARIIRLERWRRIPPYIPTGDSRPQHEPRADEPELFLLFDQLRSAR